MNCRETRPLLPLFFDGELEARQMRAVALHSTRCAECEGELRQLERLQETWSRRMSPRWSTRSISARCGPASRRASRRAVPRCSNVGAPGGKSIASAGRCADPALRGRRRRAAGLGGVADAGHPAGERPRPGRARIDNSAVLDSVQSSVDSVALVTEPETNTTLLWIMDDVGAAAEPVADEWEGLR